PAAAEVAYVDESAMPPKSIAHVLDADPTSGPETGSDECRDAAVVRAARGPRDEVATGCRRVDEIRNLRVLPGSAGRRDLLDNHREEWVEIVAAPDASTPVLHGRQASRFEAVHGRARRRCARSEDQCGQARRGKNACPKRSSIRHAYRSCRWPVAGHEKPKCPYSRLPTLQNSPAWRHFTPQLKPARTNPEGQLFVVALEAVSVSPANDPAATMKAVAASLRRPVTGQHRSGNFRLMLLRQFEVSRFRNVIDSGSIPVESDVTCLVGKNESGKTALLHALQRLNPARTATFELEADYPRWLLIRDRKEGTADNALPVRATFDLEESDIPRLRNSWG